MQASIARCTQCGADEVHPGRVSSAFWHDERLVVVEDIPALTCRRCGEQFYDDATVLVLDLLRGDGFDESRVRTRLTVPVFSFAEAAARQAP
ncbi:MAG: type II toxin-antitoxin system MqsA family antitoxin [Burkholderiales bacterium]|nr:type II toxin-antitoxin system MqsA family antitoxin [Burkholderiales bacterium]